MRYRKEKDFFSCFDEKTGVYIRSGIMKDGRDTGKDPFMASFPELLDVGIMGSCIHGKRGLCSKAGIECYQNGLTKSMPNMSLCSFRSIVDQCRGNTYQFALGGCGDPDQHEHFQEILVTCRDAGIVPNFTTSGYGLTEKMAKQCGQYCGAVAVSWYRSYYSLRAIKMLLDAGVKTNIHFVLTADTVSEALERLKNHSFPDGINAIIFLLHKPVGQGTSAKIIHANDPVFAEFLQYVTDGKPKYKIGFDSCTVPALVSRLGCVSPESLDTCEGARWSAYISADMKMMPCSFDCGREQWAVDLSKNTISEAWVSPAFEDFRNHFRNACPECRVRDMCLGGCPICPEIVICAGDVRENRLTNYV